MDLISQSILFFYGVIFMNYAQFFIFYLIEALYLGKFKEEIIRKDNV